MATPTFEDAREWFKTQNAKFPTKEGKIAAYCKYFGLKDPLVTAKSGKESDWSKSGRMFGALQEGLNPPGISKPSDPSVASGQRASKLGKLKDVFREASLKPSEADWEHLGKQALAVLFPVEVRKLERQEERDAKKLARIEKLNLSWEGQAKLLAALQKKLAPGS